LAIPPGGQDFDTFSLFLVDIFATTTTTNTDLLTQDSNLLAFRPPAQCQSPLPGRYWAAVCSAWRGCGENRYSKKET
jgi:hypothetical protein